jgi:hypothetical protein
MDRPHSRRDVRCSSEATTGSRQFAARQNSGVDGARGSRLENTDYEVLIDSLKLPDPDDRHVLAAAIKAKAQVIVTANLRDFPAEALRPWDIDPKSPDEFVRDQISLDRSVIYAAVQQIADSWRNPPGSVDDVLDRLERSGLAISVAELRAGG